MDGKTINVKRDEPVEWHWYPPNDPSGMTAKQYAAEIMRNVRTYAKRPEALASYFYEGEIRPSFNRDGFLLRLKVHQGSGWGGVREASIATWLGGKKWKLTGDYRGNAATALDRLDLPEIDGRLALVGAPPKPAKGVTAWRNRWTVSRGNLCGMIAVAGEGIDPAKIRTDMEDTLRGALIRHEQHVSNAQKAREELAALPPLADTQIAAERLMALLASIGVTANGSDYYRRTLIGAVEAESRDRNSARTNRERDALHAKAAAMLVSLASKDTRPLAIGVRGTRPDGRPFHLNGPFCDAHEVGTPATAPDWAPTRDCGNGLHYIPLVAPDGTARDPEDCVKNALRYASGGDYALWIVCASLDQSWYESNPPPVNAVMIDGHKAKARTLTPLCRVGDHDSHRTTPRHKHTRILAILKDAHNAVWQRSSLEHQIADNDAAAKQTKALAERTATTLRNWRKG